MKRIITNITGGLLLALCITAASSVVSCGQQAADRNIAVADSLSEAAPQRAMTLIDSLEGESTMNKIRHMKLLLLKAKVRNKLAMPMSTDSLKYIADYFDKHGDSNERMLAYYILGCAYFDGKDAPMALQYFHEAAAKADTTDSNCDFKNLSRIYTFIGEILYKHLSPENALIAQKQAIKYAKFAKDTLNAICGYQRLTETYYYLGKYDSVISISDKSSKLFRKYGYVNYAASSYGIPIFIMVENGETNKVKPYLRIYEKESGLYDTKVNKVKKGHEIHYYIKGMCYLNENKLDSSEYFFRKELNETSDYNNHQAAAKGLYMLYKKRCNNDSVTKYAEMWNAATDSAYARMSTEHLQQMQAMYNYNRYRQTAEEAEKDALRTKYISIIIIMAIMAAAIGGALAVRTYIIRKRRARVNEIKEYKRKINELEMSKTELESINSGLHAEVNRMIEEKTKEIEVLRAEYEDKFKDIKDKMVFEDKPVIKRIKQYARKTHSRIGKEDSGLLKEMFRDYKPLSKWENTLNDNEYLICLLIRLNFVPAEICILTDSSSSNISNIRKRLLVKMTGHEGSPKDFDKYIKSL